MKKLKCQPHIRVMMYAWCDNPMSIKGDIEYGFVYKEDLN